MKRDYIEFQDRGIAVAYLITFRCYGTWLHGGERGSVDRRYLNRFGTSKIVTTADKEKRRVGLLSQPPYVLGAAERGVVEEAIREVCRLREYGLFALNVRTNHVHLATSNSDSPERMMNGFKAYATRALRTAGLVARDQRIWSRHGSTKYLWSEKEVAMAVDYVVNGQGDELPTFE